MPRLNFGVSAEVRLSCSCQENTEQLYDSIVLYIYTCIPLQVSTPDFIFAFGRFVAGPWALDSKLRLGFATMSYSSSPGLETASANRRDSKSIAKNLRTTVLYSAVAQRISKDLKGNKKA